jgi:hypothetical protein
MAKSGKQHKLFKSAGKAGGILVRQTENVRAAH